jgi:tetratricopeptide (TPR) repeat protein
MRFKVSELSVREIARKLGVSFVLEGNVSKSDSNLRTIVTLIDGKNEHVVWTEDYKRSMTAADILEIQSDVALMVAANLKVVIDPEVRKRIKTRPTENTEAYSLFLQVRGFDLDSYPQGIKILERAVFLDPGFADAYATMAFWRMWYMRDSLSREQILQKVKPLLDKALQLDNNSIVAHNALAELNMFYYWDLESVEKDFQIVRQLNPSNSEALDGFAQYLWATGRNNEAFKICKANFEQDEISMEKWVMMALAYQFIGDHEKAFQTIESALRLFPHDDFLVKNALEIFINSAKYEEAIELDKKDLRSKRLKDIDDRILGPIGIAYFKTGDKNKANLILKELLSRNRNFAMNHSSYYAAQMYVIMGDNERAIQSLEKAYAQRCLGLVLVKSDRVLQPLHGDPRFEELLLKMGFK